MTRYEQAIHDFINIVLKDMRRPVDIDTLERMAKNAIDVLGLELEKRGNSN